MPRNTRTCGIRLILIAIVAVILIVAAFLIAQRWLAFTSGAELPADYPLRPDNLPQARVIEVVDGDTVRVRLDDREETVRLIGIDTPETVHPTRPVECFGAEASAQAHNLLDGQAVFLEADRSQSDADRYGRLLRYLWLRDGRLVNYELLRQGYAFEYTFDTPYRYQDIFQQAERDSRTAQHSLWSPSACAGQRIAAGQTPLAPTPVLPLSSAELCATTPPPESARDAPVIIVAVDKRAETVELRNATDASVDLSGWTLCSLRGGQVHPGIAGSLAPGASDLFPSTSGQPIWSDRERDDAALFDAQGRLISYWVDATTE